MDFAHNNDSYEQALKRLRIAHSIIQARNLFCSCLFRKRTNGKLRRMHFRYDPEVVPDDTQDDFEYAISSGLFVVEDWQKREPRTINLDGIQWIKAGSLYKVFTGDRTRTLRGDQSVYDEPGVEELHSSNLWNKDEPYVEPKRP